jgi:hypothetical protein
MADTGKFGGDRFSTSNEGWGLKLPKKATLPEQWFIYRDINT